MKTLLFTFVPVGIFVGVFLFSLIWFRKQQDGLAARYRLLSVGMWLLVLAAGCMASTQLDSGLLMFIVVIAACELERRQLARQLMRVER